MSVLTDIFFVCYGCNAELCRQKVQTATDAVHAGFDNFAPIPIGMLLKNIFRLLPIYILILCAASCHKEEAETPGPAAPPLPAEPGQRTVLVYMAAQNSLGHDDYHRDDSLEIIKGADALKEGQSLMLFIDDKAAPRLYALRAGYKKPALLKRWAEDANSTAAATLAAALELMKTCCPAEEYGLAMWSHADGWLPPTESAEVTPLSFGLDTGENPLSSDNGTQMAVETIAQTIKAAGLRFRYIFFDACLMQSLEVAYALREATDLVIASPMAIPGAGAYYTHQMRDGLFSAAPEDIVDIYLADVTDPERANDYDDYGIVFSALRTSALEPLAAALRTALPASMAAGKTSADLSEVTNYHAYARKYYYRPHYYDAAEALTALIPDDALRTPVLAALSQAVVRKAATTRYWIGPSDTTYQTVDLTTYSGVSLFVPQYIYTRNAKFTPYGDLNTLFQKTEWYSAAGWAQTGW